MKTTLNTTKRTLTIELEEKDISKFVDGAIGVSHLQLACKDTRTLFNDLYKDGLQAEMLFKRKRGE
jgi:hypothetical protein